MSTPVERHSTAAALEAWALGRTGSPDLARAIGLAAAAEAEGHACVDLSSAALDLGTLRAHPWVGDGSRFTPLVLDSDGRCFFWRNAEHEARIAQGIRMRLALHVDDDDPQVDADLALLFPPESRERARGQIDAVRASRAQAFFVLSGGPGTGKTTTVLRMLLLRQRAAQRNGRSLSIALAAPTGKAAQRLSQALRGEAERLRAGLGAAAADWDTALRTLPDSAQTLHRLLASRPREDRFGHDEHAPLPHDVVLVDEASMVDLGLMRALFDALRPGAALILVGDPDQLVSVSAGSVLADIVAAAEADSACRHHVRLSEVWRAEGRIGEVFEAVRRGSADELTRCLADPGYGVQLDALDTGRALLRQLDDWLQRPHWEQLAALCADPESDPAAVFTQLRQLQLLTALRTGAFGAEAINVWIDSCRRGQRGEPWYPGRPVLIRQNDHGRRLYNGDVGITLARREGLVVAFESTDEVGRAQHRELRPQELPAFEPAYALTIHKSQGSEYREVAIVLSPAADSRILSRQLLYTGVSRARSGIRIWGSPQALEAALGRVIARDGGLQQRLLAP